MKISDVLNKKDDNFSESEKRHLKREKLIYNITEDIILLMENEGICKKELAQRLGRSKSFVTQVLSGARNMTLRTLSDICHVLKIEPIVSLKRDGQHVGFSGKNCVNSTHKNVNVISIFSDVSQKNQSSKPEFKPVEFVQREQA